ncbi:2Fe-2S iron-sulfur cluster-binding protein [Komagataeibacter intermedius]|uniref:Ferredoxin n=2 Tax=Komagataeibacter intermedius TaxID=66229 RepID=A0A0N1FBE3_9PROT|nr:2Fe-2S iron-sulfur cluster-binding protein [Komagataeibacter intermedius]KPH87968.1 ferredoxin [Komagataeibacter intermedius AF2]MCF3635936.1 2Fe-2S iron-sulfur cluster-binding protein [Komagataeibacter intermedius]GAN86463.1 ferredoxin 2Fe-2S [Komagataeibacter intermedius TF2]GBQ68350.1 ferredoxin [Komagataeibacter intermedius NRIC 0521]
MTEVIFHLPDGSARSVAAKSGQTVMQVAVQGNVRGIDAECGGACACATCHVYVEPEYVGLIPPANEEESEMLDGVAAERRPNSRLACQITVPDDVETFGVDVPECQF